MSLADAIALISSQAKSGSKRKFGDYTADTESDEDDVTKKLKEEISYPNLTIFGGDYYGNLLGLRLIPPNKQRSDDNENNSDGDDADAGSARAAHGTSRLTSNGKLNPIAAMLAKKRGIDPDIILQQRPSRDAVVLRPVASGQLHAGSVGCVTSFGHNVVTGGFQDEAIKLSRRDGQTNKLTEFGTLHRHDSSISCATLTPSNNGQLLITGGDDGVIYIWSVTNNWDCIGIFNTGSKRIIAIAAHPHVHMALSLSADNKLMMWNLHPNAFANVFTTKLHPVKETWSQQAQIPITLLFSPSGDRYSILYPRCVHHYRTTGPHAGKIFSVLRAPNSTPNGNTGTAASGRPVAWGCMSYVTDDIIILGDDQGLLSVYHVVNGELLATLPKHHKTRVKSVVSLDNTMTSWLSSSQSIEQQQSEEKEENGTVKKSKKQRLNNNKNSTSQTTIDDQQGGLLSRDPNSLPQTIFIVSGDADGMIILHSIAVQRGDSFPYDVSLAAQRERDGSATTAAATSSNDAATGLDEIDNDDDNDNQQDADEDDADEDNEGETENEPDNVDCYDYLITSTFCSLFNTKTRLTSLCVAYPPEMQLLQHPMAMNLYHKMGNVASWGSRTQYENETDYIYGKQRREFAQKRRDEKLSDYKLKVRDYHRAVAGKISSMAEGDAAKAASANSGGVIKGYGKEKYRAMDEQFQKDHEQHQMAKKRTKARASGSAGNSKKKGHGGIKSTNTKSAKNNAPKSHKSGRRQPTRGKKRF